jgi:hypothetical protein
MGFSAIQNIIRPNGVIQTITAQSSSKMSSSAVIPYDNTRPQISEGTEYISLSITPSSTTSILLIQYTCPQWAGNGTQYPNMAIFRSDQNDALIATAGSTNSAGLGFYSSTNLLVTSTSGTTSALTISLRFGPDSAGTVYMNAKDDDTQQFGGGFICTLSATEIAA